MGQDERDCYGSVEVTSKVISGSGLGPVPESGRLGWAGLGGGWAGAWLKLSEHHVSSSDDGQPCASYHLAFDDSGGHY